MLSRDQINSFLRNLSVQVQIEAIISGSISDYTHVDDERLSGVKTHGFCPILLI